MKVLCKLFVVFIYFHSISYFCNSFAGQVVINKELNDSSQSGKEITNGLSADKPIIIKGQKTYEKVKEKQDEYIQKKYEGYSVRVDILTLEKGRRFIQCFILRNDEGEHAEIYFDITDICKASRKSKDKELAERIKAVEAAAKYNSDK